MKILLAASPKNNLSINASAVALVEPLALEYIGAGLREDHDVRLLDLRVDTEPGLKETLESFQPDIIGCGAFTLEANSTKKICAEAKKVLPGILTVVGGHHATVIPQDYFTEFIDVVVIGEGVRPFKEICEHYEKKRSFEDIDNIYYRENGRMVLTGKTDHPPIDTMPDPDRTLTSHLRHHYRSYYTSTSFACVRGSAGCTFRCKFCAIPVAMNKVVTRRSIERIIRELASIREPTILWVDDEFFLDTKRAVLLAKEVAQAGIKKSYAMQCRSDTIVKHPECIEEWSKVGLEAVTVGFEAHRDEDLKKMRKGTTLAKNEEVVRILHENNIQVAGNFILHQDYTEDDFKQAADYIRNLEVDTPSFSIWTPLPGTEIYEDEKDNLIIHDFDFYDLFHTVLPTKLPLKRFYKVFARSLVQITSPAKKRAVIEHIAPEDRVKFFNMMSQLMRRLENLYQDYEQTLW